MRFLNHVKADKLHSITYAVSNIINQSLNKSNIKLYRLTFIYNFLVYEGSNFTKLSCNKYYIYTLLFK